MALVRLSQGGQVTLPAEMRAKLNVADGDYLDAEVVEGGMVLRPVTADERALAWDELMRIVKTPKWKGPGPEPSEEEIAAEVAEVIAETRREHAERGSR